MNRVLLVGRLHGDPIPATTTGGDPVATIHVVPSDGSNRDHGHPTCRGIPCIVSPEHLQQLRRWHDQGLHLVIKGCLTREVLWYSEQGGHCTLQVRVERCSSLKPRDVSVPGASDPPEAP